MAPEHKVLIVILVVAVGVALGYGIVRQFQPPQLEEEKGAQVLFSFEGRGDISKFQFTGATPELATENVTHGMYSLRVTFSPNGGYMEAWHTFPSDWRDYTTFYADITNGEFVDVPISISFKDEKGEAQFQYNLTLSPGTQPVQIPIATIGGKIDISRVWAIRFTLPSGERSRILYFDNIRLTGKKAKTQ